MVKYLLIFIFALCLFFQGCSAPVAVGYNKNVVVDTGEDNWFDSEIVLPDNSLVEFSVIGSLETPKKKKSFSISKSNEYSFSAKRKKDELLSSHKILKARVINKNSKIIKTFVINSTKKIFCPEGGTLWFEAASPDEFKQIVNVHVKEVEGLAKKKKHKKSKDKMGEARARLAKDMKKEVGGQRLEVRGKKQETRISSKKGWNLESSKKSKNKYSKKTTKTFIKELEKEIATEEKKGTDKALVKELKSELKTEQKNKSIASKPIKKSLAPEKYVKIREKEEIPLRFNEESTIELVKLSKAEEKRLLSDILGISDPIEPFNRIMFKIDKTLFIYILNPLGKVYSFIVPGYFREGFKRMDYNIQMPKRFFNNLLQAKFAGAGITFSRFLVNTTIGIIGFYDPAESWFGWKKYDEDLGQTLGKWGVGPGFYVYLPIISSTSVRDGLGGIVDDQMDPRAWIPFGGSSIRFIMKFNNFTLNANDIEQQLEQYFDPYSLKKEFWYMKRTAEIAD